MATESATIQSTSDPPPNLLGEDVRVPFHSPQKIVAPVYLQILDQIHALGKLPEGWDSYGASRVDEEARTNAARFATMLVTHMDAPVPVPVVGPSAEGGVILRWESGDLEVVVKVLKKGGEYYVARRDRDDLVDEGEIGRLEALVSRLRSFLLS